MAMSAWSWRMMLIPNHPSSEMWPCVLRDLSTHTSAMGGSRETDVTPFAVIPCISPSDCIEVMMVTPVANRPQASRYSRCGMGLSDASVILPVVGGC